MDTSPVSDRFEVVEDSSSGSFMPGESSWLVMDKKTGFRVVALSGQQSGTKVDTVVFSQDGWEAIALSEKGEELARVDLRKRVTGGSEKD